MDNRVGSVANSETVVLFQAHRRRTPSDSNLHDNQAGGRSGSILASRRTLRKFTSHAIFDLADILKKTVIHDRLKEFDDDINANGYGHPFKSDEQGATPSPTSLPGPENMMPQTQLDADVSPRSFPDSTSMSDRLLRKKSASSYEKPLSLNGVPQIGDLPVMPWCLRQAQDVSVIGPFAPPTAGNFPPPHSADLLSHSVFTGAVASTLGPVFDATFRSALPVDGTMPGPIPYSHLPVSDGQQGDMPTALTDTTVFTPVSYGASYSFPNEHSHVGWIQHGQRDHHGYS